MSNDDKIQNTVEQAITGLRGQLEGELRAFVGQLERAEVEERNRVVAQAVEAASEQLRKEAEARLAQVRDAAQREAEELRREGERRTQAHQDEITELRAAAAAEAETLRREVGRQTQAHQHEIEETRAAAAAEADRLRSEAEEQGQAHQRELEDARKAATSDAESRLTEKLAVVSEEHWRRMNTASATIDELKHEIERVRQSVATEAEAAFSSRLTASVAEHQREMSAAGAKVETLIAELNEVKAAATDADRRVTAQLAVAIDDRERERRETTVTFDELHREVSEARAAAAAAAEGHQHDRASAESTIASLTRQMDEVRRSLAAEAEERLGAELAVATAQHERVLKEGVDRARDDGRQEEAARVARLEHAIHTLDDARTLSTALEELGRCAAREADRSAILLLKNGRIQGWRLFGFGDLAPKSIDLDLESAGVIGEVVRSGEARHGATLAAPGFAQGGEPRVLCALPVTVGWTVVAVLYADAPVGAAPASGWPTLLDVLARHASKVLETTTLQQAVGLSTSAPANTSSTGGAAAGPQHQSLQ